VGGETNLDRLLAEMAPQLLQEDYVFCSMENGRYGDFRYLEPIATCLETEGLTLLVPKARADEQGLGYESVYKGITLTVHSSLQAVGLTAAVATALAGKGIAANIIAGYYHDHIFVPAEQVERALTALEELTGNRANAGRSSGC